MDERPGERHGHRHVGQLVLDRLERADGMAELMALAGVADRVVEQPRRSAHQLGRGGHRSIAPRCGDQLSCVGTGCEDCPLSARHRGQGTRLVHLRLHCHARGVARHGANLFLSQRYHQVCHIGVGGIPAGQRGHRNGQLPGRQGLQILRAAGQQPRGDERGLRDRPGRGGPAEFLQDPGRVELGQSEAIVLLGDQQREDSLLGKRLPQRASPGACFRAAPHLRDSSPSSSWRTAAVSCS